MVVLIAGPTGVDVLVDAPPTEPVVALAATAAARLHLDPGTAWMLGGRTGELIDPQATVADLPPGMALWLIDPDLGAPAGTRPANEPAPVAPLELAPVPGDRGGARAPLLVTRPTVAPPAPVIRDSRPRRPHSALVAGLAAAVVAVGLVGFGLGRYGGSGAGEPAAGAVGTSVPPPPPPAVVVSGATPGLGPIGNLAPDGSARPGQILTAPTPGAGTADGWRWQACPTETTCEDIPDGTHAVYRSPPTVNPITMRVLVHVTTTAGGSLTWVSAPFHALPEPPPTTTTTLPPTTTTTAPPPVEPDPAPPAAP